MGASRFLAGAALCAAFALTLLSGCGNDERAADPERSAATPQRSAPAAGKSNNRQGGSAEPRQGNKEPSGADTRSTTTPHNDSAGGIAQFRRAGGDNSLQEFGTEAEGEDFEAAAAALHGFLDARAAGDWKEACAHLASAVLDSFGQLAQGQGNRKPPACPRLLRSLSAGVPPATLKSLARADVGAVRIEGDRAFVFFHGARRQPYFMPMAREEGEWKVAALAASALP